MKKYSKQIGVILLLLVIFSLGGFIGYPLDVIWWKSAIISIVGSIISSMAIMAVEALANLIKDKKW